MVTTSYPVADGVKFPIMLLTHPRSCSTAFERVLMTRRDALSCLNEPFADPSFFGPEACVERHHANGEIGARPGFEDCTFKSRMELIEMENVLDKRCFVKDMAFQLSPWQEKKLDKGPRIAPSYSSLQTDGDFDNPSVLPLPILSRFTWTFLIRHPQQSIPSLYRLSATPEKREATGWQYFLGSEAGYRELRQLFDYLDSQGLLGDTNRQQQGNGYSGPCVIDAADLLKQPERTVEAYCNYVGLDYQPAMLQWDTLEDDEQAAEVFATWTGFHMDAIRSRGLKKKDGVKIPTSAKNDYDSWVAEFGAEGARIIQDTIDANLVHYLYLKKFAMRLD
ncbi:hypothetical protein AJ79_06829 [Helicocarpus griseus UAMH5409]|uniref:Sulfotransferase domain-containing protein n=1 Tax=Helicocarpus griseus UAMH5409 TaxID=1447875 RepID=A0A2B7X921_9EURO|nr:hypothetical protein AJ79_06829 [Helicocarpus griseus UAMH5409]